MTDDSVAATILPTTPPIREHLRKIYVLLVRIAARETAQRQQQLGLLAEDAQELREQLLPSRIRTLNRLCHKIATRVELESNAADIAEMEKLFSQINPLLADL